VTRKILANAVLALVLAGTCAAALFVTNRLAAPRPRVLPPADASPPDYAAIIRGVGEQALREDLEEIGRAHV
jgi:hypothetical protein